MSAHSPTVLVIVDEELLRLCLCAHLERRGYATRSTPDGEAALALVETVRPDVVLLDLEQPRMDAFAALRSLRTALPDIPFILITPHARLEGAMKATRLGARAFLTKPFDLAEAAAAVARVLSEGKVARHPESRAAEPSHFAALIGDTEPMRDLRALLGRVAVADPPTLLIEGESGTGKSLAAECLHRAGTLRDGAFVEIDCASLPEHLLEADLFGQWHGRDARRGAIEAAGHGTLVLDNVAHLPLALQGRLLRALERRAFRRDAGVVDIPVHCTVIATSRVSLRGEVRGGRFREDLYYRLGLVTLTLPPLRERLADLPLLTDIFLARLSRDMRRDARSVAPAALAVLQRHAWPGNVRELRSVLERALILQVGVTLQAADLPPEVRGLDEPEAPSHTSHSVALPESGVDLGAMERGLVLQALGRARWDTHAASAMLGLSVDELVARMVRYELTRPVEDDLRAADLARHEGRGASVIALGDGRARRASR